MTKRRKRRRSRRWSAPKRLEDTNMKDIVNPSILGQPQAIRH
jgi:hypothetical protein